MKRLTEQERNDDGTAISKQSLIDRYGKGYPSSYCRQIITKLADYEDLEEQGKLLKLPCAVGDMVYTNTSMQGWYFRKENRPYKARIVFIGINGVDDYMNVDFENGHILQFKFSEIGKTIFYTQEEAINALQRMKESANEREEDYGKEKKLQTDDR